MADPGLSQDLCVCIDQRQVRVTEDDDVALVGNVPRHLAAHVDERNANAAYYDAREAGQFVRRGLPAIYVARDRGHRRDRLELPEHLRGTDVAA